MAFQVGTATNQADLLARIRTFALANGWHDVYYSAGVSWVAYGEGDTGTDEIYVEFQISADAGNSRWHFQIRGAVGYRPGSNTLEEYIKPTTPQYVSMWNNTMDYWLVVTPRRIAFVAKVSTYYTTCYTGLTDPPATHAQFPYPMLIGGTSNTNASYTSTTNCAFLHSTDTMCGFGPAGVAFGAGAVYSNHAYCEPCTSWTFRTNIIEALGTSYVLFPALLRFNTFPNFSTITTTAMYVNMGQITGFFITTGYNQSPENVLVIGGDNYVVFPSYEDQARDKWFALKLE